MRPLPPIFALPHTAGWLPRRPVCVDVCVCATLAELGGGAGGEGAAGRSRQRQQRSERAEQCQRVGRGDGCGARTRLRSPPLWQDELIQAPVLVRAIGQEATDDEGDLLLCRWLRGRVGACAVAWAGRRAGGCVGGWADGRARRVCAQGRVWGSAHGGWRTTSAARPRPPHHPPTHSAHPPRSSLYAISSGSVSVPTSTITGAFMEICSARVPSTLAFSYFVR